ncbi:MAG: ribbon-helix-helix protein, CopG family [Woeseiaceae bacterium]
MHKTAAVLLFTLTSACYSDHLGSPIAATDASGAIKWRESYTPLPTQAYRCSAVGWLAALRIMVRYNVHIRTHENASMTTTMTIRLEDETRDRLDKLAESTQRSRSFLAAQAIRDYVELNEWQVREIREAIKEADRGEFASEAEVKRFFDNWRKRAG